MASATLLSTARANNGWGWGSHSQRPSRDQLGFSSGGFTSLREEGQRQRHAGVWRQGRNTSLDSGAEIRVEQRGGETVIEFARSGEAQGEFHLGKVLFACVEIY